MNLFEESSFKKVLYALLAVLLIAIITVISIYLWYEKAIENSENLYSLEEIEDFDTEFDTKSASSSTDKNISEVVNENKIEENVDNKIKNEVKIEENVIKENSSNNSQTKKDDIENKSEVKQKKELKFMAPVDGEIIKDFANETLIYSKTLDEWTTHLGIDIKGAKTSVVKASETGKIESIKNDPRYGLTITISHQDGFKTVYSNLLTTEFVKEGDNVDKGDTIATIGETASFEVLDEPHLHFEMYKDEQAVNPTIYLK